MVESQERLWNVYNKTAFFNQNPIQSFADTLHECFGPLKKLISWSILANEVLKTVVFLYRKLEEEDAVPSEWRMMFHGRKFGRIQIDQTMDFMSTNFFGERIS